MKILRLMVVAVLLVFAGGVASAQQSKSDETLEFRPHWSIGVQGGAAYISFLRIKQYKINGRCSNMNVWIVFEYVEHGNKVIGIYKEKEKAEEKHKESPTWRYIEEYEVE